MMIVGPRGGEQADASPSALRARIFVGIKVAPEIASELARLAKNVDEQSIRPVAAADIHLTLVPPWNEPSTRNAVERLGSITGRFAAFLLFFRHVGYGPQLKRPRLIWVDCAATDELAALHAALLQAFGRTDQRPFRPHITLARIRANGAAFARKHPIDHRLSLTQQVETIELFQSPPPHGSGYRVLASLRLGEGPDVLRGACV